MTFLAKEEEKAEDEKEASSGKDVRDERSLNNMHKSNKELNLIKLIHLCDIVYEGTKFKSGGKLNNNENGLTGTLSKLWEKDDGIGF